MLAQVVESVVPPDMTIALTNETAGDLKLAQLQNSYPLVEGICNPCLPNTSVLDRFVWVVNFFTQNGFYVAISQQTNTEPITPVRALLLDGTVCSLMAVQFPSTPCTKGTPLLAAVKMHYTHVQGHAHFHAKLQTSSCDEDMRVLVSASAKTDNHTMHHLLTA